ncbi:MAG TPA: NADH-quinone oxidoreductase subunit J [Candidatus Acidoferrum sp.]|nr:NADH-quinone oxidoreductase subunit J [Candidatus Acidoferrum sp.]
MLDSVLFYFFGGVAVLSAVLMVTRRNAMHSAVFLITTLMATAGIFLQLRAEFLFIAQIILYVGGIMVLFIFVIMLVRLDVALHHVRFRMQKMVAVLVALALGFEVLAILYAARRLPGQGLFISEITPPDKLPPNSEELAKSLFSAYLLPFEIASVLLLVAMVGAVVMAKSKKGAEE